MIQIKSRNCITEELLEINELLEAQSQGDFRKQTLYLLSSFELTPLIALSEIRTLESHINDSNQRLCQTIRRRKLCFSMTGKLSEAEGQLAERFAFSRETESCMQINCPKRNFRVLQ